MYTRSCVKPDMNNLVLMMLVQMILSVFLCTLGCAAAAPATSAEQDRTIIYTSESDPNQLYRINSGGGQIQDFYGDVWSADKQFLGEGTTTIFNGFGQITGRSQDWPAPNENIYRTVRTLEDGAELDGFSYMLPMSTTGTFRVRLHFCETLHNIVDGGRIFNITINGDLVRSNVDIRVLAKWYGPYVIEQYVDSYREEMDITLVKASRESLPPILNAFDISLVPCATSESTCAILESSHGFVYRSGGLTPEVCSQSEIGK